MEWGYIMVGPTPWDSRSENISMVLSSTFTHLFDRWLGQNSKQNKLSRQLGDVQIRMRLKVSADKSEIRQSYIPALFPHIVKPLIDVGVVSFFFGIYTQRRLLIPILLRAQ